MKEDVRMLCEEHRIDAGKFTVESLWYVRCEQCQSAHTLKMHREGEIFNLKRHVVGVSMKRKAEENVGTASPEKRARRGVVVSTVLPNVPRVPNTQDELVL